jgi:hypothetical protein
VRTLILVSCLVAACDAGEKPAPAPTPARPGPKLVAVRSSEQLEYLPADSDVIIKVDVAALRRAKLAPVYTSLLPKLLAPGFASCKYDPASEITSVMIALPVKIDRTVFVVRGIDRDKADECLRNASVDYAFADAHTLVLQRSTGSNERASALVQHRAGIGGDAAFVTAFDTSSKKLQGGAVTVVSRPGSKALEEQTNQLGTHLQQLYGSAQVSDRLDVRLSFVLRDGDEATKYEQMVKTQLDTAQMKQLFDRIAVHAEAATVTIDLGMTETQLRSMIAMVGALVPSL